ncbi:PatB family C-S lyase [Hydrogenibacillus schlegelii]|uniref:cysteine-S-conjugate beta-lyase n=1 Tax=Hydrogenibacillus schlegelii TaxID=1484 RepID=A0A179IS56_HYDSH|nr:PatB family C-S lyase [Hydrogenibacillus schlegelii]OAR04639.1 hypothetical protein SA87_08880 [Hydrogenibacillus schlegelii]
MPPSDPRFSESVHPPHVDLALYRALRNRPVDRRHTASIKWERHLLPPGTPPPEGWIALSVADMDFPAPAAVVEALRRRVEEGLFGYTYVGDGATRAVVDWLLRRHGWAVDEQALLFAPGVIPAIALAIEALTPPGTPVVVFPPVYGPFYRAIEAARRKAVDVPLLKEGPAEAPRYRIDVDALRSALDETGARAILLCHPHNPGGRVFTRDELAVVAGLAERAGAVLLSDEIHADLTHPPATFTSLAALPEAAGRTVAFWSPGKTFNLPGLRIAYAVVLNPELRTALRTALERLHLHLPNALGITALEAAYRHGEGWLEAVLAVIRENIAFVRDAFARALPEVRVMPPEGTTLVWMDLSALPYDEKELRRRIVDRARVGVNFGGEFGPGGAGHIRLNFATARPVLEEGVGRLIETLRP